MPMKTMPVEEARLFKKPRYGQYTQYEYIRKILLDFYADLKVRKMTKLANLFRNENYRKHRKTFMINADIKMWGQPVFWG